MRKITAIIAAFILGLSTIVPQQSAIATTDSTTTFGVETAILKGCGEKADGKNGEGIICILEFVVEIMTVGVGILATIGLSVAGVQYLTAGGSEEQTRKAKRRIFEIVIGLAAYVLIYAILYFLLPDFKPFS